MINLDFILYSFLVFTSGCYTYFHFVNMSQTARRIRIVNEIFKHPEGMTLKDIERNYSFEEQVDRRIDRMISSGQIKLHDKIILHKRDGFYFIKKLSYFLRFLMKIE